MYCIRWDHLEEVSVANFSRGVVSKKLQPLVILAGPTCQGVRVTAAEDQADVEKVLAGDVGAFESIVRRWQGPLVNLAYRFCHDRGRAEEMAQEAFLRVYRGLAGW